MVSVNDIDAEMIDYEMDFEKLMRFYLDKSWTSKWQMFNKDPLPTKEQEMAMIRQRYIPYSGSSATTSSNISDVNLSTMNE
ncbi:hypothetical protein Ciccas_011195 [Cichlidogyrus casuarinus]|uniref:Uncharacterized protein n=1 Tax=Cichlidogyrus casuarinus TaxID=1844966 RepID=A0ABD2PTZ9_9PLAT